MGIGEDKDFRMVGFQQVQLFEGQDHIGGVGSAMLEEVTGGPFGGSNFQNPSSPGTTIALGNNNFTFPGATLPNVQPPVVNISGGGGTAIPTPAVLVQGGLGTPIAVQVDTLSFTGSGLVNVTTSGGVATIEYENTGGPGGSTLKYGKITATAQPSATVAIWNYTIAEYSAGAPNGITYSARNLLEWNNNSTAAYGYAIVAGTGNRLSTTPSSTFFISPVPVDTMVQLENTSAVSPSGYWFSAPNPITGSC